MFRPIDYQPPDIGGGLLGISQLIMAARKAREDSEIRKAQAETQRQFAENARENMGIQRESADMARAKFRTDVLERARQEEIDRSKAIPGLFQAARRSAGMANEMGKPYGVGFAEEASQPMVAQPRAFEGPDINHVTGEQLKPGEVSPPPPPDEMVPGPMQRRVFAQVGGERFEVPTGQQSTGLGDKYDALVRQWVDSGVMDEQTALKAAVTMAEKDAGQQAIADRAVTAMQHRDEQSDVYRRTVEEQNERDQFLADEAMKRVLAAGRFKLAVSGSGPAPPGLSELLALKESGASDAIVAARAEELGIPPKVWGPLVKETGKATEKHTQLTVTDPDGNVLGEAHSTVDKRKLDDANLAFGQLVERTKALADHIRTHGTRIAPWNVSEVQKRQSLKAAAASAGRKYHDLGVSNANIELEHKILGPSGTFGDGLIVGANPEVVDQSIEEATKKHAAGLKIRLRSGAPGDLPQTVLRKPSKTGKPKAPALSDDAAVKMAKERLAKNPNDPVARRVLQMHGVR